MSFQGRVFLVGKVFLACSCDHHDHGTFSIQLVTTVATALSNGAHDMLYLCVLFVA